MKSINILLLAVNLLQIQCFTIIANTTDSDLSNQLTETHDEDLTKSQAYRALSELRRMLKPLPVEDLKCFAFAKSECSPRMARVKLTLMKAIQDLCLTCTTPERQEASVVATKLILYNDETWKIFLTRFGTQQLLKFLASSG